MLGLLSSWPSSGLHRLHGLWRGDQLKGRSLAKCLNEKSFAKLTAQHTAHWNDQPQSWSSFGRRHHWQDRPRKKNEKIRCHFNGLQWPSMRHLWAFFTPSTYFHKHFTPWRTIGRQSCSWLTLRIIDLFLMSLIFFFSVWLIRRSGGDLQNVWSRKPLWENESASSWAPLSNMNSALIELRYQLQNSCTAHSTLKHSTTIAFFDWQSPHRQELHIKKNEKLGYRFNDLHWPSM